MIVNILLLFFYTLLPIHSLVIVRMQHANDPFRSSHRELISQAVLDSAHSLISMKRKRQIRE